MLIISGDLKLFTIIVLNRSFLILLAIAIKAIIVKKLYFGRIGYNKDIERFIP